MIVDRDGDSRYIIVDRDGVERQATMGIETLRDGVESGEWRGSRLVATRGLESGEIRMERL